MQAILWFLTQKFWCSKTVLHGSECRTPPRTSSSLRDVRALHQFPLQGFTSPPPTFNCKLYCQSDLLPITFGCENGNVILSSFTRFGGKYASPGLFSPKENPALSSKILFYIDKLSWSFHKSVIAGGVLLTTNLRCFTSGIISSSITMVRQSLSAA